MRTKRGNMLSITTAYCLSLYIFICVVIRALLAAHHHCSGAVCQRQGIVGIVADGV